MNLLPCLMIASMSSVPDSYDDMMLLPVWWHGYELVQWQATVGFLYRRLLKWRSISHPSNAKHRRMSTFRTPIGVINECHPSSEPMATTAHTSVPKAGPADSHQQLFISDLLFRGRLRARACMLLWSWGEYMCLIGEVKLILRVPDIVWT